MTLLFDGNFDDGTYNKWSYKDNCMGNRHLIVSNPRTGRLMLETTVKPGDTCFTTGGNERSEISVWQPKTPEEKEGSDLYYGLSVLFPSSFSIPANTNYWGLFTQVNAPPGSPQFSLSVQQSGGINSFYVTSTTDLGSYTKKILSFSLGWHDFIFRVLWHRGTNGLIEIWHKTDTETTYTKVFSQTGITLDIHTNYQKTMGLYRSQTMFNQVVYHSEYKIGTTFDDVKHTAGSVPPPPPPPPPSIWQCDIPLNGYEVDQYGNRRINNDCLPPPVTHHLSVRVVQGQGLIEFNNDPQTQATTIDKDLFENMELSILAIPGTNNAFDHWTNILTAEPISFNPVRVLMASDMVLEAYFKDVLVPPPEPQNSGLEKAFAVIGGYLILKAVGATK